MMIHKAANSFGYVFSFLALLSFACESKSQSEHPLVDVQTHPLQFHIKRGKGIPILFESGGGNDGSVWEALVDSLYSQLGTTLLRYDRAGYGQSGSNPNIEERQRGYALNAVMDLEKALQSLEFQEEIIIVAHSYGGFLAAIFAERNPQWVKGIVLLDANLKCFFDAETRQYFREMGTDSLLNSLKAQNVGLYYEAAAFDRTIGLIQKTTFPEEVPIFNLIAEQSQFDNPRDVEKWMNCHDQFGASNPNWVNIMAKNCGHYIQFDNPQLVCQKILELYEQVTRMRKIKK